MNLEELFHLRKILTEKITKTNPQILKDYPVEELVKKISKKSSIRSYSFINKEIKIFNQSLTYDNINNKYIIGIYYNLVLLTLIINNTKRINTIEYPEIVVKGYNKKFDRIVRKIANWNDDIVYQPLSNDKYLKDMALCQLLLIPVGPQYIEIAPLSKRFLLAGGFRQFLEGLLYIVHLGGFSPYYKLKTNQLDPDLIAQFNPEGWEKLLKCVHELMLRNKQIKGLIGSSWFFDPQLEFVDKEIVYIREKFLIHGAKIFLQRMHAHVIKDAIFLSNKRKKLFSDKMYVPRNYMMILSRKSLLRYYQ